MINKIEQLLKNYKYVFLKKGNAYIYIINDEKILVVMRNNKNNIFSITRKTFSSIDDELLPYGFILIDEKEQLYYYQIKEPNNPIRKAFDSSKKEMIFFGKEVLNNKINFNQIDSIISKM